MKQKKKKEKTHVRISKERGKITCKKRAKKKKKKTFAIYLLPSEVCISVGANEVQSDFFPFAPKYVSRNTSRSTKTKLSTNFQTETGTDKDTQEKKQKKKLNVSFPTSCMTSSTPPHPHPGKTY